MIWFKASCRFVVIVDLGIRDVMVSANGCWSLEMLSDYGCVAAEVQSVIFLALIFSEVSWCLHCLLCLLGVCVGACVCVCELGHIWLAFDLGEALRCMPRCERLGCSLLSPCPVTLWQRLLLSSTSQFSAAAFRGEGREVSFLFPTDSTIIGPFWWLTKHLWLPPGPNFGLPRDYY